MNRISPVMYIQKLLLTVLGKKRKESDSRQNRNRNQTPNVVRPKGIGPLRALWNGWRKCFDIRTRIGRAEFIWFFVGNTVIVSMAMDIAAIQTLDPGFLKKGQDGIAGLGAAARHVTPEQIFLSRTLLSVGLCLLIIPLIGLFARRMRDLGWRTKTIVTVGLIPLGYITLAIGIGMAHSAAGGTALLKEGAMLEYLFYGFLAALVFWLSVRAGKISP